MDFGGSFTKPYHLEILVSTLKFLTLLLLMNLTYNEWILVALLLHLVIWKSSCPLFTTPCHLEILVSALKLLNITIIDEINLL